MNKVANTKVKYTYIPKRVHGITNKNHVLYDGKLDSSIDKFSVLRNAGGQFVLPASGKEKKFLIDGLGITEGDLNINKKDNEFLRGIVIEMPKHGIHLDLSKPQDLLTDIVLRAYDNIFAPNLSSTRNKASYRYVRVFNEDEIDMSLRKSDVRKEFYKLLGVLEESRERMVMYLLNSGKRVSPTITDRALKHEVNSYAEQRQEKFIATLNDPLFLEKGMLGMAVVLGVVEKRSSLHFFEDQPLAVDGEPATEANACIFLKSKKNSDVRLAISKQTLDGFNGVK